LPEVKIPPNSKAKKMRRGEGEDEGKSVQRENSPKSRNVISLPPQKGEELEKIKKKIKINEDEKESFLPNIKSIQNLQKSDEKSSGKDLMIDGNNLNKVYDSLMK